MSGFESGILLAIAMIVYAIWRTVARHTALAAATEALRSSSAREIENCLILHYAHLPRRVREGLAARRDELVLERGEKW